MKIYEVVREEALKYGRQISDDDIEYVIWTHTGYPAFWNSNDGETPEECFRTQLNRFFRDPNEAERLRKEEEQELLRQSKEKSTSGL
jgi:hypothetical protein